MSDLTAIRGRATGRLGTLPVTLLVISLVTLLAACGGGSADAPAALTQQANSADANAADGASAANTPGALRANTPPGADGPPALDTTKPTVKLTAPVKFAAGLTGTIALTATATDDTGVQSVTFQVDGAQVGSPDTAPPYSLSLDTERYTSGQHLVRARSQDAAGNVSGWSTATVQFGGSRPVPAGFTRNEAWVTGLVGATAFAELPDGRLLVAQQGGALRVIKAGVLLAAPFIQLTVDSNGERGLIGVTPDPDFANNGHLYLHYTSPAGGAHNRVSRFTANGDTAVAGSELVLFDLPPLVAKFHNGGAIHFGLDGKLYVGVGDNKRSNLAQDLSQPFGKLLRFNADGSIPASNPFYATQTGLARAIWAYGLRNPFTFAVQPLTGRIHVNDVGQDTWEEVNLGASGANYGWPGSEGPDNVTAGITAPLFTYAHAETTPPGTGLGGFFFGYAIVGGAFYPSGGFSGSFPSAYRNNYYFADYVRQFIGRIDLARNNAAYDFASLSAAPVDLLVGADGAVYVLGRTAVTRISRP